jgi:rubrerythrin
VEQIMAETKTIAILFELAIAAEEAARAIYLGLEAKFVHLPQAADFWRRMAVDEEAHARELRRMRDSLTDVQLSAPATSSLLWKARQNVELATQDHLSAVENLDDAYRLAQRLEGSEVNTIYEVLMTRFLPAGSREDLIVSQIRDHTTKLLELVRAFGEAEARQTVRVERGPQSDA